MRSLLASPWISSPPIPRPTGTVTAARAFALTLAKTLRPREIRRFDHALQNIEIGADRFRLAKTNELHPTCSAGLPLLDSVAPGQVLIVYAEERKEGGVAVANPTVDALAFSVAESMTLSPAQRHRLLIDTALQLLPRNRASAGQSKEAELLAVADAVLTIAGIMLTEVQVRRLRAVAGRIPAVAIIAKTDTRRRPSVDARHVATTFPGEYFGTSLAAGKG